MIVSPSGVQKEIQKEIPDFQLETIPHPKSLRVFSFPVPPPPTPPATCKSDNSEKNAHGKLKGGGKQSGEAPPPLCCIPLKPSFARVQQLDNWRI